MQVRGPELKLAGLAVEDEALGAGDDLRIVGEHGADGGEIALGDGGIERLPSRADRGLVGGRPRRLGRAFHFDQQRDVGRGAKVERVVERREFAPVNLAGLLVIILMRAVGFVDPDLRA